MQQHSENAFSFQGARSSPFTAVGVGYKKEKKKQAKEDRDRQKQEEKKRRRLEKALATSAAIRFELEKKKQKKKEEEQRLDEEGAALAEAVALNVLLDEDTERVTHLEAFAEIGFESLNILSGGDQNRVKTCSSESYLSSPGPFDSMHSSGLQYHRGFACAFIDSARNIESLYPLLWQSEFMHRLDQNGQVAVMLDYENCRACTKSSWEQCVRVCSDKGTCAIAPLGSPLKPTNMRSLGGRNVYNIDAGKKLMDAIGLK